MFLLVACGSVGTSGTPSTLSDLKECTEMAVGGLRRLADERDARFNGKADEAVARCRGGDKAAAFRHTPYVD